MGTRKLSFSEVKQIPITDYLASSGFEPARIRGDDYWYHSPFREERTPSFKVNTKKNVWYDHGTGEGGTILDLGAKLNQCTLAVFLEKLSEKNQGLSLHRQSRTPANPGNALEVISVSDLASADLLHYLRTRRISENTAKAFCKEVDFRIREKTYKAVGFPNRSGSYELRNNWFKGSSSPKDVSFMNNNSASISVFEGFMDFLSAIELDNHKIGELSKNTDFLVLNSLRLLNRSLPLLHSHKEVNLFLDNDLAARDAKQHLINNDIRFNDASTMYQGHKDVNEYLVATGDTTQGLNLPGTRSKGMKP